MGGRPTVVGVVLAGVLALAAPGVAQARTAYVTNFSSNDVTPIDVATGTAGPPITVGSGPYGVAITPDGATAYVADTIADSVTPIDLATGTAGPPTAVGVRPQRVAIAPDGATAYVTNVGSDSVTPIDVATGTAGPPTATGAGPYGIAITPDGATAYVANSSANTVTPIDLATGTPGPPIAIGQSPQTVAIAPDGATAYVTNTNSDSVTPIDVATGTAGLPIAVGTFPAGVAITPDGATAYVANDGSNDVTPIDLATGTAGPPIAAGASPHGVAIAPDGATAYVTSTGSNDVTPIDVATNTAGPPIAVGATPGAVAFVPNRAPVAAFGATAVPVGAATTFDAAASADADGTVARFDWDFGDGAVLAGGGAHPSHVYAHAGSYTATLTVTDQGGCSTAFVFTGQTASCSGSPVARTTRQVTVAEAPAVPTAPAPQLRLGAPGLVIVSRAFDATCRLDTGTLRSCRIAVRRAGAAGSQPLARGLATSAAGARRITVRLRLTRAGRHALAHALGGLRVTLHAQAEVGTAGTARAKRSLRLLARTHRVAPPGAMFDPGDRALTGAGRRFLERVRSQARNVGSVRCAGHAAAVPGGDGGAALSRARARVACRYLRRLGLDARYRAVGRGNRDPRPGGLARNRYVALTITHRR